MKLFEFLIEHKAQIIELCRGKVLAAGASKPTSALLDRGLPVFYDELIEVLRRTSTNGADGASCIKPGDAAAHGKESLRLGYTISQVVHAYGAVCQSITEYVQVKAYAINAQEFHDLNLCLDCAIAEAVTEFEKAQSESVGQGEIERLGALIHELGSSLAAASVAHQMMQRGHVGSAGATSKLLSGAHDRMRHMIEGARAEVRVRGEAVPKRTRVHLVDIMNEVEATELLMGNAQDAHLVFDVNPAIQLTADRYMVFSALSNLVNNAMKFTKKHGNVSVRGKESAGRIVIEVEDECGGLPDGTTEDLFKPFVQRGIDQSGMGLGLSLSRQAIELNHGHLTARSISDKGCVFTIDLPTGQSAADLEPAGHHLGRGGGAAAAAQDGSVH